MVDNIGIWSIKNYLFMHLNKNFFAERNGIFIKFNNDYTYKLINPHNRSNDAFLRIEINEYGTYFKIVGSLRKWFYGSQSLKDFTIMDFVEAIALLSSTLEIPFDQFCEFSISMIEIGKNIKVSEKCSNILNMIVGYKSSSYDPATYRGYKRFNTANFGIKIYDKPAEILKQKAKHRFMKTVDENNFITENLNKNWLRVEFKIKKGKNLMKRIEVKTIGELIDNFNKLYIFFWENAQMLHFSEIYNEIPVLNEENISDKKMNDYLRVVGMHALGLDAVCQLLSKLKNRGLKSKIKGIYENPSFKFSSYDKLSFLNNIMGQIVLDLIKSGQAKFAKEIVPTLRANSTYNTIKKNVDKSKH